MPISQENQLSHIIDHNKPDEIFNESKKIFSYHYSDESFLTIEYVYKMMRYLYNGSFPGYRSCNTNYHDFNHMNHVFIATARIIDGLNLSLKPLNENKAVNLMVASLLHDTGYIQEESDIEGTGAKYTTTHEYRGVEFTKKNYKMLNLSIDNIPAISSYIECTSLTSDSTDNLFGQDFLCGAILATADIIGQMADRAYLEKLLFLYYEFVEAGIDGYNTAFDILRKTHMFYESTMDRLNEKFHAFYEMSKYHFKERYNIDENLYMVAIENQINYLKNIIDNTDSNFRDKLHRLDIQEKN